MPGGDSTPASVKSAKKRLKLLEAKKEVLFLRLQQAYDLSASLDNLKSQSIFRTRCTNLEQTEKEFNEIIETINDLNLDIDEEYSVNYHPITAFHDMFVEVKNKLKEIECLESINLSQNPIHSDVTPKIKLPPLQIPKFSGKTQEWPLFYQTFQSMICDNKHLSDRDKIHYLSTSLIDKAKSFLSGLPALGENFPLVWNSLKERFEDQRALGTSYLESLLNFKAPSKESASSLDSFLQNFVSPAQAFLNLKLPDSSDFMLLHLALSRLHVDTVRQFEAYTSTISGHSHSDNNKSLPTFLQLIKFLREHAKVLDRQPLNKTQNDNRKTFYNNNAMKPSHSLVVNKYAICCICEKAPHPVYTCTEFKKLNPKDRFLLAKRKALCLNCLSTFHKTSQCNSSHSCFCGSRHHSLIHYVNQNNNFASSSTNEAKPGCHSSDPVSETQSSGPSVALPTSCDSSISSNVTVLLATAQVLVQDSSNQFRTVRALIDSASQSNLITLDCCNRLRLPKRKINTSVKGVGSLSNSIRYITKFTVYSRFNKNHKFIIEALVIDKITGDLPSVSISVEAISHFQGLQLADDSLLTPSKVDLLLGASLFPIIMKSNRINGPPNSPSAFESCLGYVVMGVVSNNLYLQDNRVLCCSVTSDDNLESLVSQFWAMEDIPLPKAESLSLADDDCENIFNSSVSRTPSGRYCVSLPFKLDPSNLGESKRSAMQQFLSLEKRLDFQPEIRVQYHDFLRDFLNQGHMSLTDNREEGCFLPHHYVLKPDSSTTKLRVVWNASCRTTSGLSLNDVLHTGPKLHSDLRCILLRFRAFQVAVSADIKQMYRQILINPSDKKFQKFLWRFSQDEDISCYTLNTVTFGVKPAPYLALRTLKQLFFENESTGAHDLSNTLDDFYIDDYCKSFPSVHVALSTYENLISLFMSAGFELVKWCSNSSQFLDNLPAHIKVVDNLSVLPNDSLKILGLRWSASSDLFMFYVVIPKSANTKREILSLLARIFDPLGFLSPLTVYIKLLLHELWSAKITWDEPIDFTSNLIKRWNKFLKQLPRLSQICIPRYLGLRPGSVADLIGFCDSSSKAYGAVIYVKVQLETGEFCVNLLTSRTKVSPKSALTIPRLELCAATLLARLFTFVIDSFRLIFSFSNLHAFSDSAITLHWLSSAPSRWNQFVSNRVKAIQSLNLDLQWRHIKGTENPADCLSRGLLPSEIVDHPIWNRGPPWLLNHPDNWPQSNINLKAEDFCEQKSITVLNISSPDETSLLRSLIETYSCYNKLLRIISYLLRWKNKSNFSISNYYISPDELLQAEIRLLKYIQLEHFSFEYDQIKNNTPCSPSVRKLNPFIDKSDDLIRVGGRLSHSSLSYEHKHPVLLPKSDPLINLIIDNCHKSNLHTGPNLVLALLRKKYWILGARGVVRQRLHACNICFRSKPHPIFPLMGDLPSPRVNQSKPFLHTGVDYAGPFYVTPYRKRGIRAQKVYVCLFVCLCVKAIHIEIASDLSTEIFLNAFKRFLARRGPVDTLYSDCGTNFIGARSYLDEIYQLINNKEYNMKLGNELSSRRINFRTNPPSAPHHGGIWERQVRSIKSHLFTVSHGHTLTLEEFSTILVQVEALLNSRPLGILSSDPNDPSPLTPAHFLLQVPLTNIPAHIDDSKPDSHLSRYQLLDRLVQQFWRRWHLEYLHTLQTREKWNTPTNPIKIGTIVILIKDSHSPLHWPIARVEELHPGKDGIIRVATVRVGGSKYRRPVTKLCPLPTQ